ncbi:hypothetical protein [Mycobacterium sp. NAZ190054]|uniref:hypothetical protein n=1 Tax=Mycobacterium sp. NAZ190054 TaxID=1747766 RepID=UPI0018D248EE|nr:hypothetical protein [Mycobacterium sp. NAZ190054]
MGVATLAVGMVWPIVANCAPAAAEPSPGVPCLELVQEAARVGIAGFSSSL